MKAWKKILLSLVGIIGLFLVYVAFLPADFAVKREVLINASPEAIFPYVNNPQNMDTWNPWLKPDPNIKLAYSGSEEGVGAVSRWEGNSDVGAGMATVIESVPGKLVRTRLDYEKPFTGTNTVEFTLEPQGTQTKLTWGISGKSTFVPRLFCTLFMMNMEKVIGGTFETGLAELKALVESKATK